MRITWLGHSGFRIEIADQVLLVDPWLAHPLFDAAHRPRAIEGATAILISHGHHDHIEGVVEIAKQLGVPIAGIFDLTTHWQERHGVEVIGFNKGGTIRLGEVAVTMVNATHSSSFQGEHGPVYAGTEFGLHDRRRAGGRSISPGTPT